MKIGKVIGNIRTKIGQYKYARKEARIDKHFKIHDFDIFGDSFDKMYGAREGIAKYAADNAVQIDVFNAQRLPGNYANFGIKPEPNENLSDKILVTATNILTGHRKTEIVPADTTKLYPKKTKKGFLVLPIKGENLERACSCKWFTEDTFLRNLYRSVETLVNDVKK